MSHDSPPYDNLPPHVVQPKPGAVSNIIRRNEQQRHEAARRLAERHNAALRLPRGGTAS
jgi:hypothetical protein